MRIIKYFEDFKLNNLGGQLITLDDVIECIKKSGVLYARVVKNNPDVDNTMAIRPLSVTDSGEITVDVDGSEYVVDVKNVEKLDY